MYPDLPFEPKNYHICPCCGTEFGNDDAEMSPKKLRDDWLRQGAPWFFGRPPAGWSAEQQLDDAGIIGSRATKVTNRKASRAK